MTTTAKLTTAQKNALAAIALTGDLLRHIQFKTRWALERAKLIERQPLDLDAVCAGTYQEYRLSEEGKMAAESAPLWKAAQALLERGYEIDSKRRAKPGFMAFIRKDAAPSEHGRTRTIDTAWISDGTRAYIYQPKPTPEYPHQAEVVCIFPTN